MQNINNLDYTKKIGFIGQGWIGKNYADDFENRGYDVVRYGLEEPYVQNKEKIKECDIVFIAVPTPSTPDGFDDSILKEAVKLIGNGKIAVIKSTLLPGRTELIQKENQNIYVVHSPEFLTEATAVYDATNPNRNIVGLPYMTNEYKEKAKEVMAVLPKAPFEQICSSREAELIKYGGNNLLYFKVIFINLLYDLSSEFGARYEEVKKGMMNDSRIGSTHLDPIHKSGRGAGGHCFIKDFSALTEMYKKEVGDQLGINVLNALRDKNIDLLMKSKKDLDLLRSVYSDEIIPVSKLNVLITGGAGFIGYHTTEALAKRGDNVIIVDNFNDYYDVNLKKDRARDLLKRFSNVKIFKVDITDMKVMDKIFVNHKFDKIVNLAAQAGVRYSIEKPFKYQQTNILGFLNILELCRKHNVKDLVYASSSSVYGNNKNYPYSEKDNVDSPISLYAATKKSNEEMAYTYHNLYGMNVTGLRFFTVYGPWGRPDMGVFKFVKETIENGEIDVYNNGDMARDFTYIDDIVSGVVSAIDKPLACEIVNIARGESVKLMDYIGAVEKVVGKTVKKNMMPIQSGDVKETNADISKAREIFNYNPKISVSEGVKKFVNWYLNYYKNQKQHLTKL
ncbi:GDP-mannose 4,6-dehydratase [Candidatus Parcubacteria bacterium]|nr:GDP-mannose 4,6-dehydratase [Candidatus Parcubacteria bacterium]